MGIFDFFTAKRPQPPEAPEPPEPEFPPTLVIVVREGMSTPSEDEVVAILGEHKPDLAQVSHFGLSQPVWWRESALLESGLSQVASAFEGHGIDPHSAQWQLGTDAQGASFAIVLLFAR